MSALIRSVGPETPVFRAPPHNLEAEQALLGAILVNNEAIDRVSSFLKPTHFYDALHGRLYEAASKLILGGKRATPITLKTFFQAAEPVGELTVPQYLGRLAANATTIINAEDYGRTIYDLAIRRQLIGIGETMVNTAFDSPIDAEPAVQIEDAEQKLYELAETGKYGSGFEPFSSALTDAIDMAANAYRRDGGLSGLATGFSDLDQRMGGLQPSDLIIIAGRPSMGKTALATNIAYHVAKTYRRDDESDHAVDGAVVGFFSLEMSAEQLATRIIAEQAHIPSERIRRGRIDSDEFDRIVEVSQELRALPRLLTDHQLSRPDRRHHGCPACRPRAAAEAPAEPGLHRRGLSPASVGLVQARRRGPRSGGLGDHHRAEGARQRAARAGPCPLPALPPGRATRG